MYLGILIQFFLYDCPNLFLIIFLLFYQTHATLYPKLLFRQHGPQPGQQTVLGYSKTLSEQLLFLMEGYHQVDHFLYYREWQELTALL